MADKHTDETEGATPPGRGETNHETMPNRQRRTISGPGAADFLASSGGLDLPGTDPGKGSALRNDATITDASRLTPNLGGHEPIPGERDPNNLTGSQTGTIGGGGFEAHNPSPNRATGMDDRTIAEHRKEGGGAERERRRKE